MVMSSNTAGNVMSVSAQKAAWGSEEIKAPSHSSEIKRGRKAAKNRNARQRKQARKRENAGRTTGAPAEVAASSEQDPAAKVEHPEHQERQEKEDVAISSGSSGPPLQSQEVSTPTTPADDATNAGAAGRPTKEARPEPAADTTADLGAAEVDSGAAVEGSEDLQPQSQAPPPPPPPSLPKSPRSIYVEEGTPEFEEWTRQQKRLTAWARQADAELKRANGEDPNRCPRRFAPPSQRYTLPILERTAAFAVRCGFGPGVAPQLLQHVVATVYGSDFASSVVALSSHDVEYMFAAFWEQHVVPLTETERLFTLAAGFVDSGITVHNLRPIITGAVQNHPEFVSLTAGNQISYLENVVATTFSRLGRYGVISLDDLRRTDFAASLNAVGRHEIGLEESIFFSRFVSLNMVQNAGYHQPSLSFYGRGGAGWGRTFGDELTPYSSGNQIASWTTSPPTVAAGSWW